jgi:L(+)-tartrate dehydratase alpha subunit
MISIASIEAAMYEAMRLAAVQIPPDIEEGLRDAMANETEPLAREHLRVSLANARAAATDGGLVCGDTGFPLYFVRAGGNARVEAGLSSLHVAAQSATVRATRDAFLRPTMVDPLSRDNPGCNVGPGMPKLELVCRGTGDGLLIVAVPKGGGSEIFGTFYRMLYPADGRAGVIKFVLDSIRTGCFAGKICPPAVIGVGIGGTADLCMKMAKEAALLRPLGTRHPDPAVARIEADLCDASRALGIGPMGARGRHAVLGLHVETALTHTAALPVAVCAQCLVGRRWCATLAGDGAVEYSGDISLWYDEERKAREEAGRPQPVPGGQT